MEKLQELVKVKMELDDDLPYRAALVPQVEDLGLERFVLVDVGHNLCIKNSTCQIAYSFMVVI